MLYGVHGNASVIFVSSRQRPASGLAEEVVAGAANSHLD